MNIRKKLFEIIFYNFKKKILFLVIKNVNKTRQLKKNTSFRNFSILLKKIKLFLILTINQEFFSFRISQVHNFLI